MSSGDVKRFDDSVEVRATKDSNSLVIRVSRPTGEAECERLAAEGWKVELVEIPSADRQDRFHVGSHHKAQYMP